MDLDDVVKVLIPKSKRKQWKRRLKKEGFIGLLQSFISVILPKSSVSRKRKNDNLQPPQADISSSTKEKEPMHEDLGQAHTYLRNIRAMVEKAENGSLERLRLEQMSMRVTDWVEKLEALVIHALEQGDDDLLEEERKRVPKAIRRLEKQVNQTTDNEVRQKLERTLENRREQLALLEQASRQRQLVELKIENTVAQLGIIYTQLHSGQYLRNRTRYERMAAEITDEVEGLNNYLASLNELRQTKA